MIHVCFGLHDASGRYSKFTGTAMLSILENLLAPPQCVTIHILHDKTLTADNRDKFIYVAGKYEQLVKFYNVEELCADKIEEIKLFAPNILTSIFSIGCMYRLLIPQVLPEDIYKAIYLDSDMLVNLDINEFWRIELGDKPIAAVPEYKASPSSFESLTPQNYLVSSHLVRYKDYFNSGSLVMNLDYLRAHDEIITNGIKFLLDHPQCNAPDQDILNYLFSKIYLKLPAKFDRFIAHERHVSRNQIEHVIYHYTHPWLQLDMNDIFNRLWFRYFVKTPWFNEDTIGRLYENYRQLNNELKNSMANVSAAMHALSLPCRNLSAWLGKFSRYVTTKK